MGVDGIAAATVSMSGMQLEAACNTALLKKSMESMEQQAMSLINDMAQSVPVAVPGERHMIDMYI